MGNAQPNIQPDVFKELEEKDLELQEETKILEKECVRLASLNGAGDSVRRKIRASLIRFLGSSPWDA